MRKNKIIKKNNTSGRNRWLIIPFVLTSVLLFTSADISGSKTTFTSGTNISATQENS